MKNLHTYKYYYFIGIGGIGMSSLARYFNFSGKKIWGYDKTKTLLTHTLEKTNHIITYEDNLKTIPEELTPENTLVIYTPAIPPDLQIKNYFIDKGFTLLKRSEVLGKITKDTECIAIAGTHGKTTTSTLIGHLCKFANLPSTAFLGGISMNYDSNFIYNGNKISIVEADEFDRSFLKLFPNKAIISSTDADHLDIYKNPSHVLDSFNEFAKLIPKDGFLLVKKGLNIQIPHITYSATQKADYFAKNIKIVNGKFTFDWVTPQTTYKNYSLNMPGIHNIENAIAALSMGLQLGIEPEILKAGLASFQGIKRRFIQKQFKNGKIYIDDYAHHPTELNATVETIRKLYPQKKLLTVFQPHLFSRTKDFADDFAKSLEQTDSLILLDIYPAREIPIEGINSEWLSCKIKNVNPIKVSSLNNAIKNIQSMHFDVLLTVGAGDIDTLYPQIINWLENEA